MIDIKTCLITGAGNGLGKSLAKSLAEKGYHLILADIDENRLKSVKEEIFSLTESCPVETYAIDLSLQGEIRRFCNACNQRFQKLDMIINNAGVNTPFRKVTAEGFEYMFAVNYLAPYLLTTLLFNKLQLAGDAKIINIGSNGEKYARLDFDNLQGEKSFNSMKQYCLTKLCLLMFSYHLAKDTASKGVAVCCVHPGGIKTHLMDHYRWYHLPKVVWHALYPFLKNADKAAGYVVKLTDMEVYALNGKYFSKGKEAVSSAVSLDKEMASGLWNHTLSLVDTGFLK
ncbi:MAG: SDR family NAD(P)-dependent oxidoreductase [Bacteroidales bacterium]|nr:SDR family NAD(P)-dependent oxidoreductase [Bacteroidales bacterium]